MANKVCCLILTRETVLAALQPASRSDAKLAAVENDSAAAFSPDAQLEEREEGWPRTSSSFELG